MSHPLYEIYLGDCVDEETAKRFFELAQFRGKDSAIESARKARYAFETLGIVYRVTCGGDPIHEKWKGYEADQFGGWVPSREDQTERKGWD